MKWTTIHPRELSQDLCDRWSTVQDKNPVLASPYFCSEFTQAVASVRDDVRVGILETAEAQAIGFFPFHRRRGGQGRPIGLGLSDYHGVIAEAGDQLEAPELLRECTLARYEFDHLPTALGQFRSAWQATSASPFVDLTGGYHGFEASRDRDGRKLLKEIARKRSRLEENVGSLRYERKETDSAVLETLMQWKAEHCRATGTVDYFAFDWCRELIRRLHQCDDGRFGGILSALYVNDDLAAAHFTLRSERVWHSWFPVYNDAYRDYSPGMILLEQMIRDAAETRACDYLDFGKGVSLYKKRFMTGAIEVAEGAVELPSLWNRARQCRNRLEEWSRSSILRPVLRVPGRLVKTIERKQRYN